MKSKFNIPIHLSTLNTDNVGHIDPELIFNNLYSLNFIFYHCQLKFIMKENQTNQSVFTSIRAEMEELESLTLPVLFHIFFTSLDSLSIWK